VQKTETQGVVVSAAAAEEEEEELYMYVMVTLYGSSSNTFAPKFFVT
jgi:hypothetical protein